MDENTVPSIDTAFETLLRDVHDLMHDLHSAGYELHRVKEALGRSVAGRAEHFGDAADGLVERLGSVSDRCRGVLRAAHGLPRDTQSWLRQSEPKARPIEVLWVDDDGLHLSSLGGPLDDAGWHVTTATAVEQALALVEERQFDAVLVDLIMPSGPLSIEETAGGRLTGLALSRRIRRLRPTWPIVFLTVSNDAEVMRWCRDNPPATVLFKPHLRRDTVRQVESLIRYGTDSLVDDLESLIQRLPTFIRAITPRHAGRPGIVVADEYDIQDLLRGLLALKTEDVREEEWSPSYAGGSSRIDFVLPAEQVAVEVKMTRPGLKLKQLGEQLLVDIARYRAHPDVRTLLCVVVDSASVVLNEFGFIKDLRKASSPELMVRVVITRLDSDNARANKRLQPSAARTGARGSRVRRRG